MHTHTHTEAEALWQHRTSKHSRLTDVRPDWLSRASRFEYSRIFASGTAAVDSSASEGGACGRGGAGLEVEGGSAASRSSQNHSSKHDCGVCQISFDSEEALCGFLVFLRAACACPIACGSGFVTWSMCVRVGTRVVCIPAQWNIRLTAIGADFPSCVLCVSACGCVCLCVRVRTCYGFAHTGHLRSLKPEHSAPLSCSGCWCVAVYTPHIPTYCCLHLHKLYNHVCAESVPCPLSLLTGSLSHSRSFMDRRALMQHMNFCAKLPSRP